MKSTLIHLLPAPLAHAVVFAGKRLKKILRSITRARRYGTKPFTVTVPGLGTPFKFVLDPYHNGTVDEVIATTGAWEPTVSKAILDHLHDEDNVFLDIGANIGYHTLSVATHLRDKVTIHAFEPIPRLCRQITESLALNEATNVTVHKSGLGLSSENRLLYLRPDNIGGSGVVEYTQLNLAPVSGPITVPFTSLDEVLTGLPNLTLIKIDVEGYEFEVLQGGQKLLQKFHPVIIMEFSPMFYRLEHANKANDFIDFLESLGYETYTLNNDKLELKTWLTKNPNGSQIDIVCK